MGLPAGSHPALTRRAMEAAELQPSILSEDPLVIQFDSFLNEAEASEMVSIAQAAGFTESEVLQRGLQGGAGGKMDWLKSAHRDSQTTFCTPKCYASPTIGTLLGRAQRFLHMGPEHTELQFLQYFGGQYYRTHSDYLSGSEKLLGGPRVLTLLMYLSEVDEGGETHFPAINLTVHPRAGRAVLWPSVLNAEPLTKDVRTRHQALPVMRGTKYAANLWYYHRDIWAASELGCMGG